MVGDLFETLIDSSLQFNIMTEVYQILVLKLYDTDVKYYIHTFRCLKILKAQH